MFLGKSCGHGERNINYAGYLLKFEVFFLPHRDPIGIGPRGSIFLSNPFFLVSCRALALASKWVS